MFEILQPTAEMASDEGITSSREQRDDSSTLFDVDRATIVTTGPNQAAVFSRSEDASLKSCPGAV